MAIRKKYEKHGVEAYYKTQWRHYHNPHFEQVRQLLIQNEQKLDYTNCLDFACGGGEVSMVLAELGYHNFEACDPFTYKLYQQKLKRPCNKWSFEDVVRGVLKDHQYSTIICSFAMHLCPPKQLYPLATALLRICSQIAIITPHKRPSFQQYPNILKVDEDFTLTARGKKVRMKTYQLKY